MLLEVRILNPCPPDSGEIIPRLLRSHYGSVPVPNMAFNIRYIHLHFTIYNIVCVYQLYILYVWRTNGKRLFKWRLFLTVTTQNEVIKMTMTILFWINSIYRIIQKNFYYRIIKRNSLYKSILVYCLLSTEFILFV